MPAAPSTSRVNASVNRAAELEDVPDLDAPPHSQLAAAAAVVVAAIAAVAVVAAAAVAGSGGPGGAAGGAGVTRAHLGGLDGAVGREVPSADHVGGVPPRLVGPGQPGGAGDHPGVDQVAEAEPGQHLRPEVAPDQPGVGGPVVEDRHGGRVQRCRDPLEVHLPVAGQPDHQRLGCLRAGPSYGQHHVLQGVGGGPVVPPGEFPVVGERHQGGDGRGLRGVVHLGG